jgi:hypothetical protein
MRGRRPHRLEIEHVHRRRVEERRGHRRQAGPAERRRSALDPCAQVVGWRGAPVAPGHCDTDAVDTSCRALAMASSPMPSALMAAILSQVGW